MIDFAPNFSSQSALIQSALTGNGEAAARIQTPDHQQRIIAMLVNRGAAPTEAEEIAGDIWSEALQPWKGKRPLLARFDGEGDVIAFLGRCALNRLIDRKRRARFQGELPVKSDHESSPADRFDMIEGESGNFGEVDDVLIDLLRESLATAMSKCPPEPMLMIKLVSLHGVQQKTLALFWGWSPTKICRVMAAAIEQLRADTLAEIKRVDPWLEVEWNDIVKLCAQSSDFLK